MEKYYNLVVNSYAKGIGVLLRKGFPTVLMSDAVPVEDWKPCDIKLLEGTYDFHFNMFAGTHIVSEEFKDVMLKYAEPGALVFYPVHVHSETLGDKTYYLQHFTKVYDVIDWKHSVRNPADRNNILFVIKVAFDPRKVEGLHVLNCRPLFNEMYVSNTVRKELKKLGLTNGVLFTPVIIEE